MPRGRFAVWAAVIDDDGRDLVPWRPVAELDVMGPDASIPRRVAWPARRRWSVDAAVGSRSGVTQTTSPDVVSVMMSIYNRAEYLDEAVRSVLADASTTHELVLVDDGSTDGAAGRIVASSADSRWCSARTTAGCPAAWNLGLAARRAVHFVTFCDSDDLWIARPHRHAARRARSRPGGRRRVRRHDRVREPGARRRVAHHPRAVRRVVGPIGGAMLARRAVFDARRRRSTRACSRATGSTGTRASSDAGATALVIVDARRAAPAHPPDQNSSIVQSRAAGRVRPSVARVAVRRRASS